MILWDINSFQKLIDIEGLFVHGLPNLWAQLLDPLYYSWHTDQFVARRATIRINLQHNLNKISEVFAVVLAYFGVNTLIDLFEEALHILCLKWWIKSYKLVDYTS